MSLKIYNTLTRTKEEFVPRKKGKIEIYVCGPTVYDDPHIGHARSAYIFDVIIRYLRHKFNKSKITFVRNITDIDDKIIAKARQLQSTAKNEQKRNLNALVKEVATKYTKIYHEAMDSIGLDKPDKEPKATEHIKDMQNIIKDLIKKGFAYESGGDVYFEVKKFGNYGKLSKRNVDELRSETRKPAGEEKKDTLDFALWKKSKPDEPEWPSPWGKGRPGWHIECSAMSGKYFKGSFDIHGGGLDLIFPHHENEIAQSKCAGQEFAKYWIHNGLLTINSQKMSKSLGNFITIEDFIAKHKSAELLKMLFLSAHYRSPVDYTEDRIKEMAKARERITIFLRKVNEAKGKKEKARKIEAIEKIKEQFIAAMDDDFNAPLALAAVFELVNLGNNYLSEENVESAVSAEAALLKLAAILGLSLEDTEAAIEKSDEELIKARNEARRKGDFKKSDEIRAQLLEKGIIVEDTKTGTLWRRKV